MQLIPRGTRVRLATTVIAALAATTLGLVASPAQAAPTTQANGKHCVADLTGRAPLRCFATFTAATAAATGGRLTDAPISAAKAMSDPAFSAKVDAANRAVRIFAASDIVISVEYDARDWDETAGTLTWTGDKECSTRTTDVDYVIDDYNVSAPAWVNRITSFKVYGNCWAKHFENPHLKGASVGFESGRMYIGDAMDNRTSSEQWS
jgi:hypothetical protein